MTDYRTTGVHQINGWLWNDLKNLEHVPGTKAFEAYGSGSLANVSPFTPAQQQAEFTNIAGGAPFIVYNYVINSKSPWAWKENGAYAIYDNDVARLRAIHMRMIDLLSREDKAAADVNSYLYSKNQNTPWDFKWVIVTGGVGPDVFAQEGGRQGATISTVFEYTRDQNDAGLRI